MAARLVSFVLCYHFAPATWLSQRDTLFEVSESCCVVLFFSSARKAVIETHIFRYGLDINTQVLRLLICRVTLHAHFPTVTRNGRYSRYDNNKNNKNNQKKNKKKKEEEEEEEEEGEEEEEQQQQQENANASGGRRCALVLI